MNKTLLVLLVLLVLAALVINQRHSLLIWAISSGESPPLLEQTDEGSNVTWADDYFTVERLGPRTIAIGEPRYHQQNYSYLISGDKRALLFDAGPGVRDIRRVAESLTDLPITFLPSHFHFDHVGGPYTFEYVAVADLPYLRERARDNQLLLETFEHLGAAEGFATPTLEVDEWLAPGAVVDLGNRQLRVLYTPGHTEESVSLLDMSNGWLFSGDFIYPGPLIAFLSNSSLPEYLAATERLLDGVAAETELFGAHRIKGPGAPRQGMQDVRDLQHTLTAIQRGEQDGSGFYPYIYPVNDNMELWAEPPWLQTW